MDKEMSTLHKNQILPPGKRTIGCHWVYTFKLPNDYWEGLKAQLVAKGYTQTYGVNYLETFSPIARLNFDWILPFVVV
jgi:hypothetical protein